MHPGLRDRGSGAETVGAGPGTEDKPVGAASAAIGLNPNPNTVALSESISVFITRRKRAVATDALRSHRSAQTNEDTRMSGRSQLIVLTAPFTEMIDHAGYFIPMGMASIPIWMEGVINRKYPSGET